MMDIAFLRECLDLDPETGVLLWRRRPDAHFANAVYAGRTNRRFAGKPALETVNITGYKGGRLLGENLLAHRVVWALTHGEWPKGYIDHINRIKTDNRPCNLRDVSAQINRHNRGQDRRNTSGVTGVNWNKKLRKWHAQIAVGTEKLHLGFFSNVADAAAARLAAEARFPLS